MFHIHTDVVGVFAAVAIGDSETDGLDASCKFDLIGKENLLGERIVVKRVDGYLVADVRAVTDGIVCALATKHIAKDAINRSFLMSDKGFVN